MKSYSVSIDPDARIEIKKAASWYNDRSPGLGDRFRAQVFKQIDSLWDNPRLHAIRRGRTRTMAVSRFPFLILFVVLESEMTVIVYNVVHKKINPDYWPRS